MFPFPSNHYYFYPTELKYLPSDQFDLKLKRLECAKFIVKLREASKRPWLLQPSHYYRNIYRLSKLNHNRNHSNSNISSKKQEPKKEKTDIIALTSLSDSENDKEAKAKSCIDDELEREKEEAEEDPIDDPSDSIISPPTVYDLALECHSNAIDDLAQDKREIKDKVSIAQSIKYFESTVELLEEMHKHPRVKKMR